MCSWALWMDQATDQRSFGLSVTAFSGYVAKSSIVLSSALVMELPLKAPGRALLCILLSLNFCLIPYLVYATSRQAPLRPFSLDGSFGFRYEERSYEIGSTSYDVQTIREELSLRSRGYFFHPGLVRYSANAAFSRRHGEADWNDSESSTDSYHITTTWLP